MAVAMVCGHSDCSSKMHLENKTFLFPALCESRSLIFLLRSKGIKMTSNYPTLQCPAAV